VVWSPNGATYTWSGQTVPATGASLDCPDNIYRLIPLDASSRYEVRGHLRPMHPAQFSFQLLRDAGMAPSGNDNISLGILSSRDMEVSPDGSFSITLDSDPSHGRSNHLQLTPGPLLRLLIRDTTSSWKQCANAIIVERIDGPPPGPEIDEKALTKKLVAELSDWVRTWSGYISRLYGPPVDNVLTPSPPAGRTGDWGYLTFIRFQLPDEQAIVLTIDDVGAEYTGGQITDIWGILPDPQKYLSSYNVEQSHRNADGTLTYIIAPRDPGELDGDRRDAPGLGRLALARRSPNQNEWRRTCA
jgi:hypothetical protein